MKWKEYGITNYQQYLQTEHWKILREELLYKRGAKCYICNNRTHLLPHHIRYDNLFNEKEWRDIYILCFFCHKRVHFWTSRRLRIPLKTNILLYSMRLRKEQRFAQKRQFRLFLLWFLLSSTIALFWLLMFILGWIIRFVAMAFFLVLKELFKIINIEIT